MRNNPIKCNLIQFTKRTLHTKCTLHVTCTRRKLPTPHPLKSRSTMTRCRWSNILRFFSKKLLIYIDLACEIFVNIFWPHGKINIQQLQYGYIINFSVHMSMLWINSHVPMQCCGCSFQCISCLYNLQTKWKCHNCICLPPYIIVQNCFLSTEI